MKAKRSCIMKPRRYHKVKLRTASGGSLTIRYRKRPSRSDSAEDICNSTSGSSCSRPSEAAEASSCASRGSHEHSLSNVCNFVNDQGQEFDDLADLPEYSQISSCVSAGVPDPTLDAGNLLLYNYDIQPGAGLTSSPFWSSDPEYNSSDIGSNDVLAEFPEGSCMDIPTADSVAMSESFWETENANFWTETQAGPLQCFSVEQSTAMLSQQLKFNADGIEFASTFLGSMEAYEEVDPASHFWSTRYPPADDNIVEQSHLHMQGSHMSILCFPSIIADESMDTSAEVELLDLPPLLHYETGRLGNKTLQHYESIFHGKKLAASCLEVNPSTKEDGEFFDENSFLLLDPGIPDEVNLENSGMLQAGNPWGALLELSVLQVDTVAEAALPQPIALQKDIVQVNEAAAKHWPNCNMKSTICSTEQEPAISRRAPGNSAGKGSICSSFPLWDPVASRGMRKKRLKRATPLYTLKSLLSNRSEDVPQSDRIVPTCNKLRVCSRKASLRSKAKELSDSDQAEKSKNIWCTGAHRSTDEIHVSNQQFQKQISCMSTSEEDDFQVNQEPHVNYLTPKRSTTTIRRAKYQARRRRRPEYAARRAPRYTSLLPEHAVSTLRRWFDDHIAFPFADKEEKLALVSQTGLTLTQVDNWLSNYRHRLKVKKSDYDGNVFRPEKASTRH